MMRSRSTAYRAPGPSTAGSAGRYGLLETPASVLYGAVVNRTTAAPVFGDDAERLAEAHRVLNDRIDPEKFATVTSRGATMTDDQTVAFAREVLAQVAEDRAGQRS